MMGRRGVGLLGVLLLCGAALLTAYNLREARQAAEFAEETAAQLEEVLPCLDAQSTDGETAPAGQKESVVTVADTVYLGLLEIPDLGLMLPVAAEWSYPVLKRTPCRYSGTAGGGNLVIIAHNYPAHFGRLRELAPGSRICFTDGAGQRWVYVTAQTEQLQPEETDAVTGETWELTLLTCTPGGKSRVAVRCRQVRETEREEDDLDKS